MRRLWPDVAGSVVAGFGFAAPLLRPFRAEAARTLCLMPAQQGACAWPREGPNAVALIEEDLWPLPNHFVDRLVLAHGVETCDSPHRLIEEAARVLAPGGRLIVIAPNRASLWARSEGTPFGFGRPYTYSQLEALLERGGLTSEHRDGALYAPPSSRRFWLRAAPAMERFGARLDAGRAAGVLIVEAVKQAYALPRGGAAARVPGRIALPGLIRPAARPASRGPVARGQAPAAGCGVGRGGHNAP